MRRDVATIERMAAFPLFAACTKRELALVARTFYERRVPAGTVLMRQGTPGRDFLVVLDGTATVRVDDRLLARLFAGDFAGELAVLDRRCRTADVVAETDLVFQECTAAELTDLLHEAPNMTRKMLAEVASRLRICDRALVA